MMMTPPPTARHAFPVLAGVPRKVDAPKGLRSLAEED
jgi:hypothetical protein